MKKSEYKRILKEELGLVLPDGTINGDPKGKEKATTKKYKQKEKNITEATSNVIYAGINFLVVVKIKESGGYIQLIPRTTKDIDVLDTYGRERATMFLETKLKQQLGFRVWYSGDGSAGLNFRFSIINIEELLKSKIK